MRTFARKPSFHASLLAAASGIAALASAWAQPVADEEATGEAPVRLETVRVTGTRLRHVDGETALPVTVLERPLLEATGEARLAEALRKLPYNNLGAQAQGFGVNGRETLGFVDLRGLGPNRTLVLVNGRRLTLSGQSNGSIANINYIPLSAVERVEILRDGASAVYGSDAIGGVVNIILRSDYEGIEATLGLSDATTRADEQVLTVAGGSGAGESRIFWAVEHLRRDGVATAKVADDPSDLLLGINPTGEPGTWFAADWFTDGTGVPGPWTAEADCPVDRLRMFGAWRTVHPDSGETAGPLPVTFCALRLSDTNQWTPKLASTRGFVSAAYDLRGGAEGFATVLASRLEAHAWLTTGGDLPDAIAADNPVNPGYDPDTGGAPWPVSLYFGFQQPGDRDRHLDSDYLALSTGLRGALAAGELEAVLQYDREVTDQAIGKLALRSALREAIAAGNFDPFEPVNATDVVQSLLYTQHDRATSSIAAGAVSWSSGQGPVLRGGQPLSWAVGGEFRHEAFEFEPDPEDLALNVFGWLPGGYAADARRDVWSLYVEAALPLPAEVELGYASRFDAYSLPDSSELTHKFSLSWRPAHSLLLRGSWGQGFRAPSLVELAAPRVPALAFGVVDTLGCLRAGGSPAFQECRPVTRLTSESANPGLQPETSTNYNAGLVWQVSGDVSVEVDLWGVDVDDQVAAPSAQQLLDLEALGVVPAGSAVVRNPGGFVEEIVRGRTNFPSIRQRGLDLSFHAAFELPRAGQLQLSSLWSLLTAAELTLVSGLPDEDRVSAGAVPDWKSRTDFGWSRKAVSVLAVVHGVAGFAEGQSVFDEWWSVDLNATWRASWRGDLTLGVRNLTDARPDNLNRRHHDYDGRTWYLRYRQRFGGTADPGSGF